MQQVWNTVSQFHMLEAGDRLLLGVSGGPDSVALLHLLHSKAAEKGIQTPGVGDGQGGLACCDSWGCKESDTTE